MGKFGWAYIGCGSIANTTAKQIYKSENSRIVAVWNRGYEKAEAFAKNTAEKGEKLPFYVKPMEKMSNVKWSIYMSWSENTFIELFYIPRARRSRVPNPADDLNYTHYSLEVSDLQAFRRQVLRRGGAPYIDRDIEIGLDNTWVMWMHDPDGNPFEIMEYTPASFQVIGR